jgi:GntR family transcriptional regulator/MocR family aminotransferase
MDDLLPGMLHLTRDGGETLTRQLTDQLRRLITQGASHPASACRRAVSLRSRSVVAQHRLVCDRAIGRGRLCHLSAGRRPVVAEGLSLDRRKLSPRSSRSGGRKDKPVRLGKQPAAVGLAADPQGIGSAVSAGTGG